MSVQQQLNDFMEGVKTQAPADVLAVIDNANSEIAKSGQLDQALKVGDKVPSFSLPNAKGAAINLQSLLEKGPVIVSFYRGAWCPFCNIELKALQGMLPEITRAGANLVAISPEKPDYSFDLTGKHGLTFEVLTDAGNLVAKQFGIVFTMVGHLRKVSLEAFGVDLPKFNGDDSWQLPVPATFVVDKHGVVRFSFVDAEFRHRAEPETILQVLKTL